LFICFYFNTLFTLPFFFPSLIFLSTRDQLSNFSFLAESSLSLISRLIIKFLFSLSSALLYFLLILIDYHKLVLVIIVQEWWIFLSFTNKYLFLNISCTTLISNHHDLPNNKWPVCIGTTSYKTSSLYFPIKNKTKTYLLTFISPNSFNH
jgi:hypothetical protein